MKQAGWKQTAPIAVLSAALAVLAFVYAGYDISGGVDRVSASLFAITVTPQELHTKYSSQRIKILVVPGHDNQSPGAEFQKVRETDLTLDVAQQIVEYLKTDSRFQVYTTRDFATGEYRPEFFNYFWGRRNEIRQFRDTLKNNRRYLAATDRFKTTVAVDHVYASEDVSLKLFGINKWSNEQDIDIVLHIHFNDYPGHGRKPGKYTGFTIYVPESQYGHAAASIEMAKAVFDQIKLVSRVSNLPLEDKGIVEDQDLIAVGSNASREGVSFLVEYGYIYEPQFTHPTLRPLAVRELAFQTVQGLKNYFARTPSIRTTSLVPYAWTRPMQEGMTDRPDVLALQGALFREGLYPPPGKTLERCPLIGSFGSCTVEAVKLFQARIGAESTGIVAGDTLRELNRRYGK